MNKKKWIWTTKAQSACTKWTLKRLHHVETQISALCLDGQIHRWTIVVNVTHQLEMCTEWLRWPTVCLLLFIPWVSYSKCWDDCSLLIGPMYQIIVVITFSFVLFPISYTCCDCVGECGFAVYVYYLILKHKTLCFNITGSSWNRWCPWVAGTTRENWTSRFCRPTGN